MAVTAYANLTRGPKPSEYVLARVDALREMNNSYLADRWRIRQIMNGGADGIRAVMAWDQGKGSSGRKPPDLGTDLPAVNMMASGVERLAQKVGQAPTLKMPHGPRDSQAAREAAELRERIVESWDHMSRVGLTYPQVGRWLPGYGFCAWVIRPKVDPVTKQTWPHVELRDPYDTWPGFFGPSQQPHEVAFVRSVPKETLKTVYPGYDWDKVWSAKRTGDVRTLAASSTVTSSYDRRWEGPGGGTLVVEYMCDDGTYVCVPEFEAVLEHIPNPCETGPLFVVAKRFSFDRLYSAYHHVIGLVGMMAKFNVLALITAEQSAFSETNIFGEMEGDTYERGRLAVNRLEANARVEKPRGENNFQLYQQIDRLERQLRIGSAYDAGSDSIAARGGFITGQGQRELRDPIEANIAEYQTVIAAAMEDLDTRRLEYEEKSERSKRKRVFWLEGDRQSAEHYTPAKDIGGNWRSRRVYGMMASWDDSTKIVAGLQLLQQGVIDVTTMRENLHGLDSTPLLETRTMADRTQRALFGALEQRAAQGDPGALMALVEINDRPDEALTILKRFFTPAQPEMTPEEAAMMGAGGAPELEAGPPPTAQTILAQLQMGGGVKGGVQTVSTQRR